MEPFIAQIMMFGGNFAPRGWAFCHGQLLPISQNTALFSLIGTTYGGDGRTTFGLPDLRGRAAVGMGNGNGLSNISWGQRGGAEAHTLNVNEMPNHNHGGAISVSNAAADDDAPSAVTSLGASEIYHEGAPNTTLAQGSISAQGGGQSFPIRNPFLGMNYVIALQGIFPSRS